MFSLSLRYASVGSFSNVSLSIYRPIYDYMIRPSLLLALLCTFSINIFMCLHLSGWKFSNQYLSLHCSRILR